MIDDLPLLAAENLYCRCKVIRPLKADNWKFSVNFDSWIDIFTEITNERFRLRWVRQRLREDYSPKATCDYRSFMYFHDIEYGSANVAAPMFHFVVTFEPLITNWCRAVKITLPLRTWKTGGRAASFLRCIKHIRSQKNKQRLAPMNGSFPLESCHLD
jgi:hypothetical protein